LDRYSQQAVPPIHIIVKNGHVTLVGVVANQADKNLANVPANNVPGVLSVTNNLRIESWEVTRWESMLAPSRAASGAWKTATRASKMMESGLRSSALEKDFMHIFLEYAACVILVAFVATLLFAVSVFLIILKERATVLRRVVGRGIARDASILVVRQTELIRSDRSAVSRVIQWCRR
jgi:hypothetical protein